MISTHVSRRAGCCATVLWSAAAILCLAEFASRAEERLTLNFNSDWKFLKSDPAAASSPDFNDADWAVVSAPHTYNDTDTFDDWSPLGHIGETNQWVGRAWYRKSFTLPETFTGKRVYLEFEAVRQVAEVYLNGHALGTNRTGFIPFGFDLTPHLRFDGAPNLLAVMADNRFTMEIDMGKIALTELPWHSPHWHPAHGGIYRNVFLHVADPLHISLPLYSNLKTAGPYVYCTDISGRSVMVHCEIPVQNGRRKRERVEAQMELLDQTGKPLLLLKESHTVAAGGRQLVKLSGRLENPQMWETDYPYIYRAVCRLKQRGETIDSSEVPLGIRTTRWDVNSGFAINGRQVKLQGWGQKPTSEWPGLGAAHPDWMHHFTLNLMKEAGGNLVRWGHCAGAPADIASADQLGLIVFQPGLDGEGDARGEAWQLRSAAFRDMIVYYRNNPSIVLWEGGNQKVTREHAQELRAHMATWDPHGGRAYAHRRADETTGEFMDVDIGTEGGRQVPRLPVVEGEYNREESPRRVWDAFSPPNFGYPEGKGQTYHLTSEQYAINQITQYVQKLGAANHCGGANWIFSDSTSGGRVGCEVARTSGEVDGVRLPKEAYFVCRTMFRDDPQVHIVGHWTYPAGTKKTVYVASNCEEVELFINGKSLGRGAVTERYLFTFADVLWEPGEVKAVAYREGRPAAAQSKRTAGAPVALKLTPIVGPGGLQADGSDIALVDVEAIDEKGERCPTFQERVEFDLAGPAIWRGGYNSGKIKTVNHTFLDLESGINRVAIRSTRVPGLITLAVRSANLKPVSVTIASSPVVIAHGYSAERPTLSAIATLARPPVHDAPASGVALVLANGRQMPSNSCLKTFSYSGPTTSVRLQQGACDGAKIYADRDEVFTELPEALKGSEWIQTACADKLYSAVDLMEFAAGTDGIVYIAHDNELARPDWLQRQFKTSNLTVTIQGRPMQLFERRLRSGESLTLGSNAEHQRTGACNMYVVFVKRGENGYRARS
jgi:beta-galactosidase